MTRARARRPRRALKDATTTTEPVIKKTDFTVGVHVAACLTVGRALKNLPSDNNGSCHVDGFLHSIYVDADGDLVAKSDCGQTCFIAGTKAQMTQIRDFLAAIIDAK